MEATLNLFQTTEATWFWHPTIPLHAVGYRQVPAGRVADAPLAFREPRLPDRKGNGVTMSITTSSFTKTVWTWRKDSHPESADFIFQSLFFQFEPCLTVLCLTFRFVVRLPKHF